MDDGGDDHADERLAELYRLRKILAAEPDAERRRLLLAAVDSLIDEAGGRAASAAGRRRGA